jgi:methylenetetrahydrofolate dehydrogenase (NADP+)/methenyltetrahydrofolate cyclohydrolase
MTARILDGAALAAELRRETGARVAELTRAGRRVPGLAVLLAGDDPASTIYVGKKTRACEEAGMVSRVVREPGSSTTASLIEGVEALNRDASVDGILVQLPLPRGVDTPAVLGAVHPDKDVDGFHPINAGALAQGRPRLSPCTPSGILELLRRERIPIAGARAVVVGRSLIVGRPMALILLNESATVTIAHSRTQDLPRVCREADLLVVAAGQPHLITAEHVRPGAVVVDVGMHRLAPGEAAERILAGDSQRLATLRRTGSVLVGDVDPASVAKVAGALTPVPGGVGPLTVALLLRNTVTAYEMRRAGPRAR